MMTDSQAAGLAEVEDAEPTSGVGDELTQRVEASIMSVERPISSARLSELLSQPPKAIHDAIRVLNDTYETTGRTFRIEQVAGGWQIFILPQFDEVMSEIHKTRQQTRLSPAALETLSVIAYKQPVLRAEIESIRGVSCGEVLRSLMERHLIKIVGRAEEIGRPMLYGTTKTFLEIFGLNTLKDLPKLEELTPHA